MGKNKSLISIALIAMAILSLTNLFGLGAAGVSVLVGIAFFFVIKIMEKQPFAGSGLDLKAIGAGLKTPNIWLWMALPLLMDLLVAVLSKLFLPEFNAYVFSRAGSFVSFDKGLTYVVQLAVLALGEEIAWRAFFQRQLARVMPIAPVLAFSSVLFALGHISNGSPILVALNVVSVAINSTLYGIVFHKTNNASISGLSHFAANLFSIIMYMYII